MVRSAGNARTLGEGRMIDTAKNEEINRELRAVYREHTAEFLWEYGRAFGQVDPTPPHRLNEFGIVDPAAYDTHRGRLFIAKETHGWSDADFAKGLLFRDWLSAIARQGLPQEEDSHVRRYPRMWYDLGRWSLLLQDPAASLPQLASAKDKALAALGAIAYTNLNKVRGLAASRREYAQLAAAPVTGRVLRRELQLLRPRQVVLCGVKPEVFQRLAPEYEGRLLAMPHPASRRLTTLARLELLKRQLEDS